ncbi:AKAP7 2'5' RNA ligase-like domain-containing protein [Lentinula aciculospora]|uniref:AKAP7 2'5' RNA ligase-like domain-containing protein n=1 Tax=Lentinula aciculospora TaxID=153920 RepID=A0A9W9ATY4_9AGAR|nr:AKAP7 2'5' RNA ligase-like domain-containing protein [Lentinula aciculospora]
MCIKSRVLLLDCFTFWFFTITISMATKYPTSAAYSNYRRPWTRKKPGSNKNDTEPTKFQRPTHFLCLPLGHHPGLREKMTRFQSSLLEGSVEGLDSSILIKPRRLHFTLGVMSLSPDDQSFNTSSTTSPPKTIESALELLQSLQPRLAALCAIGRTGILEASLERVGAFESRNGARVMWVSPREKEEWPESEGELEERLKLVRVAELVHGAFKNAGYITENRPLKLHCTLINTSHRKPFHQRSQLFSFTDVLASNALLELQPNEDGAQATTSTLESSTSSSTRIVRVALGTYTIPEIQLCAMGSYGPEDEYVSLGSVPFAAAGDGVVVL